MIAEGTTIENSGENPSLVSNTGASTAPSSSLTERVFEPSQSPCQHFGTSFNFDFDDSPCHELVSSLFSSIEICTQFHVKLITRRSIPSLVKIAVAVAPTPMPPPVTPVRESGEET